MNHERIIEVYRKSYSKFDEVPESLMWSKEMQKKLKCIIITEIVTLVVGVYK